MRRRPAIVLVAVALLAIAVTCATALGAAPKKVYVEGDIVSQELV